MTKNQGASQADFLSMNGHYRRWVDAGNLVYTAGLTPRDSQRQVIGLCIREQTIAVLRLLDEVLAESGTTRENIVKVNVYLSDLGLMSEFNAAYAAEMGIFRPARTTVGCELNGVLIEIEAVALRKVLQEIGRLPPSPPNPFVPHGNRNAHRQHK